MNTPPIQPTPPQPPENVQPANSDTQHLITQAVTLNVILNSLEQLLAALKGIAGKGK